jgi:hypothetical protein
MKRTLPTKTYYFVKQDHAGYWVVMMHDQWGTNIPKDENNYSRLEAQKIANKINRVLGYVAPVTV